MAADLGGVVVHVFLRKCGRNYNLENPGTKQLVMLQPWKKKIRRFLPLGYEFSSVSLLAGPF